MKAFVYDKRTNKKLTEIDNVQEVNYIYKPLKYVRVDTYDDGAFTFDPKVVKITVFINK